MSQRARSSNRTKNLSDRRSDPSYHSKPDRSALPALSVKKSQAYSDIIQGRWLVLFLAKTLEQFRFTTRGTRSEPGDCTSAKTFKASSTSVPGRCHCRHVVEFNPWRARRKEMAIFLSLFGCLRTRYRRSPTQRARTMPTETPRMTCICDDLAADAEETHSA